MPGIGVVISFSHGCWAYEVAAIPRAASTRAVGGLNQCRSIGCILSLMLSRMFPVFLLVAAGLYGDPLSCDLNAYKALPGLSATVSGEVVTVQWEGDRGQDVRLRFAVDNGTPMIR